MKIEGKEITEKNIGGRVTYIPGNALGNAEHPDCQGGTITSWNKTFVFVAYGNGGGTATDPLDLVWG